MRTEPVNSLGISNELRPSRFSWLHIECRCDSEPESLMLSTVICEEGENILFSHQIKIESKNRKFQFGEFICTTEPDCHALAVQPNLKRIKTDSKQIETSKDSESIGTEWKVRKQIIRSAILPMRSSNLQRKLATNPADFGCNQTGISIWRLEKRMWLN